MKFIASIRLLPVTIFFSLMILTVKISNIHNAIGTGNSPVINISSAKAQEKDGPKEKEEGEAKAANAEAEKGDGEKTNPEKKVDPKAVIKAKTPVYGDDPTAVMVTQDPTLLTPSEIELLQQLSQRRKVIEGREQELEMRTGLLTAAEIRIEKKIKELENLRVTIANNIQTYDEQQDKKLLSLVKIYENMKPKDAARIFENLDLETLLEVAERMKERKLAPVMAKMNAEKAREMTVELRNLRQLPPTGG
jgi:flagellar motility protein MotE (MotC chaperone)